MIDVTLSKIAMHQGAMAGALRNLISVNRGDKYGSKPPYERWGIHVEGAMAELAFARWRNCFWTPVAAASEFQSLPGDVGQYQVRSTWRRNGCLLLHREDEDDSVFVLVTGAAPTFQIVGWLYAREGKIEGEGGFWEQRGEGDPCFYVPQSVLHPMETLP